MIIWIPDQVCCLPRICQNQRWIDCKQESYLLRKTYHKGQLKQEKKYGNLKDREMVLEVNLNGASVEMAKICKQCFGA